MEALRLVNQRLLGELVELNRQMQRPQEEQQHLGAPRDDDGRGENSRTRGHDPNVAPGDDRNEGMLDRGDGGEEPTPRQGGIKERSLEQQFQDIQQELSHMKEAVRVRAPASMDSLVQQTESPFTAEVLHFPLITKFRMSSIKAFDGTKDPIDHLNTYKNKWNYMDTKTP